MTFLQALFGSQYYEIQQKGRDGNKGRLNANLFLTVMIFLVLVLVLFIAFVASPGFEENSTRWLRGLFGSLSGRSIGKILAIPVIGIIYLVVAYTVGSQANFKKQVEGFLQYPEPEKKKAGAKILLPFFVLLIAVVVLAVVKVF
jgi:hypothetical protein